MNEKQYIYNEDGYRDTYLEKSFFAEIALNNVFDFYGVDNSSFKLGDRVWEAIEDEDDGYRSLLESIVVVDTEGLIFFRSPIARVKVVEVPGYDVDSNLYALVDEDDGHEWLRFGTDYYDEYYPFFVFSYQAKESE